MLSTALPSRYASCSVPCKCLQSALLLMKAVKALRPNFSRVSLGHETRCPRSSSKQLAQGCARAQTEVREWDGLKAPACTPEAQGQIYLLPMG